ncbi:hypothetical protein FKV24_014295 [Lysobacter maris]|uniref:Lipoprotein n=1 Tax=Marilutibacter maris TaxID=1605891 RepID=A0A5N6AXK0_9GAMM|nr:hypothetical protein [Lysobacter maris]KAB8173324.1 hypothetical protein FKV24_014295 [Lysobacter maris]
MTKKEGLKSGRRQAVRTLWIAAVAVPCLLAAGCVSYDYLPPGSDAGRQCIATCATAKQTCEAGKAQTTAMERNTCQMSENNRLTQCLTGAGDDKAKKKCRENARDCSYVFASGFSCSTDYDRCYTDCGGLIVPRE